MNNTLNMDDADLDPMSGQICIHEGDELPFGPHDTLYRALRNITVGEWKQLQGKELDDPIVSQAFQPI